MGLPNNHLPTFENYIPLLNSTNSNNYTNVLLSVLRDCLHHIPLDEFLDFIFNSFASENVDLFGKGHLKTKCTSKLSQESLKLCNLVLQNLRLPIFESYSPSGKSIHNLQLFSMDFDQVIRTFLAIKIILDSIRISSDEQIGNSLSRDSVYKAYYIVWHKNIQNNPRSRKFFQQRYPIFSLTQMGKIMKLVHPGINMKRLGRRGNSTFHYLGFQWNESVIDADVKGLLSLSLLDLDRHFKNLNCTKSGERNTFNAQESIQQPHFHNSEYQKTVLPIPQIPLLRLETNKPLYSFVNFKTPLPLYARLWNEEADDKSVWSQETMKKSVEALKAMNINVEPLIESFNIDMFYHESKVSFFDDVINTIHLLFDRGVSGEAYLHLYLVVSLLIFPATFAEEKEGSNIVQKRLSESLDSFLERIKSEFYELSMSDFCNLMSFSKIIDEIKTINTFLLVRIKTELIRNVVKVLVGEVKSSSVDQSSNLSDIIHSAVIRGINAYNWDDCDRGLQNSEGFYSTVSKMIEQFMKLVNCIADDLLLVPQSMTDEDFQNPTYNLYIHFLKILVKNFSEYFVSDTSVFLPVKLTGFVALEIANGLIDLNFANFDKRDRNVSSESFKTWWILSALTVKYISLLSEVTALSLRVSGI